MEAEELLGKVPSSLHQNLSEELVELLLKSSKTTELPSEFGRRFLQLASKDQLNTPEGLKLMAEAALKIDKEKVAKVLERIGLAELATAVKGG